MSNNQHYNFVDVAKFICSILVVMIHVAPFGSSDEGVTSYLNYGVQNYLARIAVPFFFVCSGFFLYTKTTLDNFSFEPSLKYVLRLFRLYIIWSLIYFPLSYIEVFYKNDKGVLHAALSYIRDFVFTGSYSHLWYLNATIFAVLLISFLLYSKVSPAKIIIYAFGFYIIGLFAQSWFGFITPLRELTPSLWSLLKVVQKFIVTTRDGLFEAFLFVGIGMFFAFYKYNIQIKKAFFGFIISMLLLFVEVFILKYLGLIRANDMYFFLVPATVFSFLYISQVTLPNKPIYKKLRTLSSLIFYSHIWVNIVVGKVLSIISESLPKTCLRFIITMIVTIIGSFIILKLSEFRYFKWLKKLYT